ncbi:MAG: bifunctional hydroxymethylpyrimidine kinase/phosphomethylpyrimidine kinase [Lachnospiraceae bacterium]|nr:bifunctional hydroxymethylpyrimidine kinase/phosphomethylpyrimidine kinase [Lachnospiraceae bacterium]
MTNRESEIFRWICENPMISQEELAERAGITRSSVAVHISNLIKKGYIRGKGYITSEPGRYIVIGGANVDIGGIPDENVIDGDSNPGSIGISFGGVGRNIAHNMSLLGLPVEFISAFGDDPNGKSMLDDLAVLGIECAASLHTKSLPTSTYMYISNKNGDMQLAVADMKITDLITPEFISDKMNYINHASAIILDTNIPAETIEYILKNAEVPVIVDPVSTAKGERLKPVLGMIHTITPNRLEAEMLTGVKISNANDAAKAADILLEKGVRRVFITLGAEGVYCADASEGYMLPAIKADVVNTTGAGDAFTASLAYSYERGFSLKETGIFGTAASAIALEGKETINSGLTEDLVLERAELK